VTLTLLAGNYPGSLKQQEAVAKLTGLLAAGVRTFIDLTEENECLPYAQLLPVGVRHTRIAVVDVTAPSRAQIRAALDAIAEGESRGVVYLHCRGGCGRTGVVLGCYLVERGLSPTDAVGRVRHLSQAQKSAPCPQTWEQEQAVRRWWVA
jgi:protein-tyrosine phosphatase